MSTKLAPTAVETNEIAASGDESARKNGIAGRRLAWIASFTLLAFLLVLALDASLRATVKIDPYRQSNRSWVWWSVKALRNGPPPDVVICGSSLVVATVDETDATYLKHVVDQILHWRCEYLEHCLQQRTGQPVHTADLAMGGQMVSDVYSLAKVMLQGRYKPKMIVWGIAPRDFVDATFNNPNSSETVRYMTKVAGREMFDTGHSFWDRVERSFDKAFWTYGNRDQVVFLQHRLLKAMLHSLGWKNLEENNLPQPLRQYVTENLPEDEGIDHWGVVPYYKGLPFSDNRGEYHTRYNPFKPSIYQFQLRYFDKMLAFCRDNHIQLMLVNMPLMQANMALMPAGMYERYSQDTSRIAQKYGITVLDLNKPGLFPDQDYRDSVHMNGLGGQKFWQILLQHWPASTAN